MGISGWPGGRHGKPNVTWPFFLEFFQRQDRRGTGDELAQPACWVLESLPSADESRLASVGKEANTVQQANEGKRASYIRGQYMEL